MRTTLRDAGRDERGFTLVFVGIGLMAFFVATALAVDVGMSMTARAQAQSSADSGALAGATALAFNSFTDHTASGPAVQSAVNASLANKVMGRQPSVMPSDVTFLPDPSGQVNRVKINVFRTARRDNPIPTFIAGLFGVPTVDIAATATAEASPANAVQCVKPFMIPDKWIEKIDDHGHTDGPFDPSQPFTFDLVDNHNVAYANPDVYVPIGQPGYTGYTQADVGTPLVLRAGSTNNAYPSSYYSWAMPGNTGANWYTTNISSCNQTIIPLGTVYDMVQEPGSMTGPTNDGVDQLIAQDPGAQYNAGCKCIKYSAFSTSPRVTPLPLYDPLFNAMEKVNGRTAAFRLAQVMGFFVDHRVSNSVYGYIVNLPGMYIGGIGPAPGGSFPKAIRLVQ